jgi:hypothetical protein
LVRDIGGGIVDAFTPVGDVKDVTTAWSNGRYWTAGAFTVVGVASYLCGPAKKACSGVVGRLLRLDTCCFVAGTLVATENGLVPIEEIEEGDLVWSRDPETGETALKPVTALIRRHKREIWEIEIVQADGAVEIFETTDDHPWWVEGAGWVETVGLSAGQQVTTKHYGLSGIRRVEHTGRVDVTYNLTVADFQTYFVGEMQVLVHNCPNIPKKPGSQGQFKGTDALRRENRMAHDAATRAGLSREQRRILHDEISGQGIDDFQELLRIAEEIKAGRY